MKQPFLFTLACVTAFLLTSCSDAKYPIDSHPSVKIDARLLGKWVAKEKGKRTADPDVVYVLSRKDDFQYLVAVSEKGRTNSGKRPDTSDCFLSEVNNVHFLNVHNNDDSGGYFFLRILSIDAKAGKVTVVNIADTTMMQLSSSAQVRERIAKNLNNPLFYKDTTELSRAK